MSSQRDLVPSVADALTETAWQAHTQSMRHIWLLTTDFVELGYYMWDLKGDNVAAGFAGVTTPATTPTSRLLVIDIAPLESRVATRPDGKIFHDIVARSEELPA